MAERKGFRTVTKQDGSTTTVKIGGAADQSYNASGALVGRKATQATPQVLGASSDVPTSARGDEFAPAYNASGLGFGEPSGPGGKQPGETDQQATDRINNSTFSLAGVSTGSGVSASSTGTGARTGAGTKGPASSSNQTGVGGGNERYSRYGNEDEPLVEEPSYEEIQRDLMRNAQKEVSALYKYQGSLLKEQSGINEQNDRSTAAVNTLTGLAGSSEANVQQQKTTEQGQKANQQIRDQINVKIQGVLANVRADAQAQYQYERTESRLQTADNRAAEEDRRKKSLENITVLAQSGATADGYAKTDPEGYQYLAKSVGGEDVLKAMFTLNRSQDTILDKKIEGGKYIVAFQNPLDGSIKVETVDLGLPDNFSKTIDAGDRILAIPDNWDGDPSKLVTINKGLTPGQQQSDEGVPGENPQLYTGLTSKTATAVRSKVAKFSTEPMVQNFAVVQEGNQFAQSIDPNTQNPAEHQALIYALAKALDPGSVVREGEYATAQKYAQSWIKAFGSGVEQAILGTGFLSTDAVRNIQSTIAGKANASEGTYKNLQNQYIQGINSLTGRKDGAAFLVDYSNSPSEAPADGLSDDEAYQLYIQQTNGAQ